MKYWLYIVEYGDKWHSFLATGQRDAGDIGIFRFHCILLIGCNVMSVVG